MDSKPNNELGNAVRAAFKASGLSVKRLAIQSGVPYASAHGLLSGRRDAALSTAARICKVLELELKPRKGRTRK